MVTVKTSVVGASAAHQSALASCLQTVKDNSFLTGLLNDRGIKTLTIKIGTPGDNANGTTDILRQVNDPNITINKDVVIGPDGELHRALKITHNDGTTSIEAIKSIKSIITHEIVHALFPNLTSKITPKFTVHNTDDPLPENVATTDLVGEVAFRRLTINLREKIYGTIDSTDQEVVALNARLNELQERSDGKTLLSNIGFDLKTASFETIRAALKDSTSGLSKSLSKGPLKNSPDLPSYLTRESGDYDGLHIHECFLSGTPILMHDNAYHPIESIEPGDEVMAFSIAHGGRRRYEKRRVTRVFRNVTRQIIDLRGLRCTPGHVFLTGEIDRAGNGTFRKIADLLSEDGTVVDAGGSVVRARTGAVVGSPEDRLVKVAFRDAARGCESVATVRAGIPVPGEPVSDSRDDTLGRPRRTLLQWLIAASITLLDNGELRTQAGDTYQMIDWPSHSTPFDDPEMQNWIVSGENDDSYTPSWILGLSTDTASQRYSV